MDNPKPQGTLETRHRTKKNNPKNTTQNTKKMSNTDIIKRKEKE